MTIHIWYKGNPIHDTVENTTEVVYGNTNLLLYVKDISDNYTVIREFKRVDLDCVRVKA